MFIAKGITQKSSSSGAQCSNLTRQRTCRSSGARGFLEFVGHKYFVPPGLRKTLSYTEPESLHSRD